MLQLEAISILEIFFTFWWMIFLMEAKNGEYLKYQAKKKIETWHIAKLAQNQILQQNTQYWRKWSLRCAKYEMLHHFEGKWNIENMLICSILSDGQKQLNFDMVVENTSHWSKTTQNQCHSVSTNHSLNWRWAQICLVDQYSQHAQSASLHQPKLEEYQIFFKKSIVHQFWVWVTRSSDA